MIKYKDATVVKQDIHINILLNKVLKPGLHTLILMEISMELLPHAYIMQTKLFSKIKELVMSQEIILLL
jgi:hypothetical protein